MLGMLMQMLLGQTGGVTGPSKNEIDDGATTSPWSNLFTVGLRVLTALLGVPQQPADGIDKVDNQNSPMQVSENNRDVPLFRASSLRRRCLQCGINSNRNDCYCHASVLRCTLNQLLSAARLYAT